MQATAKLTISLAIGLFMTGCSALSDSEQATRSSLADPAGDGLMAGPPSDGQGIRAAPNNTTADILETDKSGQREWQFTALTYRQKQEGDLHGSDPDAVCLAATAAFDYSANTVTLTAPRRCLDNPEWIQASVGASTMVYDARPGSRYADKVWEDYAYQKGYSVNGTPVSGPRLHHE